MSDSINKTIITTLIPYKINKIALFGSYARGENHTDSDIDILVDFQESIGLFELMSAKLALESILNKKIDLLTYDSIYHRAKETILSEQKIIYEIN